MEVAIILKNLRLALKDPDGGDTAGHHHHPLDQDDIRKLMTLIKNEGLRSTQYDDQLYELSEDLAEDHSLVEPWETQIEQGCFWMVEFDLAVDGLIGVSWEDL